MVFAESLSAEVAVASIIDGVVVQPVDTANGRRWKVMVAYRDDDIGEYHCRHNMPLYATNEAAHNAAADVRDYICTNLFAGMQPLPVWEYPVEDD